jgi:hypothetical protein
LLEFVAIACPVELEEALAPEEEEAALWSDLNLSWKKADPGLMRLRRIKKAKSVGIPRYLECI